MTMLAFFQWSLSGGFWRFAGALMFFMFCLTGTAEIIAACARVIAAFRRVPPCR